VKFDILTGATVKNTVFLQVMSCTLFCFLFNPEDGGKIFPLRNVNELLADIAAYHPRGFTLRTHRCENVISNPLRRTSRYKQKVN
jgi:hypothetical protein